MSLARSLLKKIGAARLGLQILFVLLAFGLMAAISYKLVNDSELTRMDHHVYNDLLRAQARIEGDLNRVGSIVGGISQTVRNMIMSGDSLSEIMDYVGVISDYAREAKTPGFLRFFVQSELFDVKMISGGYTWADSLGSVTERPWHIAATAANGEVVFTDPYTSSFTGETIITCARRIFDDDGNPLGIIGLHITLDPLKRHIDNICRLYGPIGAYGILIDREARVLVHHKAEWIGKPIREVLVNYGAQFEHELLMHGKDSLLRRETRNYKNDVTVISFKKIPAFGWTVGLNMPQKVYLSYSRSTFWLFIGLNALVLLALCYTLFRLFKTKQTNDEFTKVMFDTVPLASMLWNDGRELVVCNDKTVQLFGARSKQNYLDRFYDFSPKCQPCGKPSRPLAIEIINKAFDEGFCRFEWMHSTSDGKPLPCDVALVRVKYGSGPAVIAYVRDLREEKAMIEKLREAEEHIQAVYNAAPLCINTWNADGVLVDCNEETLRVFGVNDKKDFIGNFTSLAPNHQPGGERSAEKLTRLLAKTFKDGHCRTNWEHLSAKGETLPFDVTFVRLKRWGGYIAVAYALDMREINAATAKLREADEFREILFNASPVSSTLYDFKFNPIECNNETLNLLGITDKQELMRNVKKYSPEYQPDGTLSDAKASENANSAKANGFCRFEWTHRHSSGELIPCEVTLVRVNHKGEDILAGYTRDLRELKAMVREAHRAEIAEESNRSKSRFLAAMSHEIRTPMNVILGITDIQLQDDTLPPHLREAFTQIYNSSDLLLGIINDILDLSKIEAGKMMFTPSKYSLPSLINDTAHLNMMRNSKAIEFELNIDENAPVHLYGDELRIKQILNNLLSNAFKFTEEGVVKLVVTVEDENHPNSDNDATLLIVVSDTGQGMSNEQVSRLFTEYTRFNLEVNRAVEGTGLGMNITRRLISMMGGDISVNSSVGKGTTVTVRLPQKRVGGHAIGGELAKNLRTFNVDTSVNLKRTQITRDYMPYGRVLIVDDVESNLYVARGLMASYGLSIDTATSGVVAIEKIKAGKVYDIIFMDHMMPKMDGMEATKIIRETGYTQPIVALTANAVVGQADVFLNNGFDEFISKPIDIRQLNAILNRFVRDKQTPDVLERAKAAKERMAKNLPLLAQPAADPELLAIFARDATKAMTVLEAVSANADTASDEELSLFAINTHAMKSVLANIGESRLSQVAYTLEKSGKAQDRKTIAMQTPSFIKALKGLIDKAEAECSLKECAATDEDPKSLKEQLNAIAKACWDYDERAVDAALVTLKKMSWTSETEDILNKIAELTLHSSFEEAAEVAATAAKRVRVR